MSVFEDKDRDRLIDCLQQINKNLEQINKNIKELAENSLNWQDIEGIEYAIEKIDNKLPCKE